MICPCMVASGWYLNWAQNFCTYVSGIWEECFGEEKYPSLTYVLDSWVRLVDLGSEATQGALKGI